MRYARTGLLHNASPTHDQLNSADFWIRQLKHPDKPLMTADEISTLNQAIPQTPGTDCVVLDAIPESLTHDELLAYIRSYPVPEEPRYIGERLADAAYYETLCQNRNEQAVLAENPVSFGFMVKNTELRTFPSFDVSYEKENDFEFDVFCETVLKTWERVAILHTSADGKWLLVQAYNYLGWIPAESAAIASRAEWQKYRNMPVMVVTENRILLNENLATPQLSRLELTMGTALPLVEDPPEMLDGVSAESSVVCLMPARDENGRFIEKMVRIPLNMKLHRGYLPYTQANVIRQAFKFLGDMYGWAGMWNLRDCSGMIMDVFLSFGIFLPRNAGAEAAVQAKRIDTSAMSEEEKLRLFQTMPAGTLLYINGHIMLYIGMAGGKPYVIHAFYAYLQGGELKTANVVAVTPLDLQRRNGNSFLKEILVMDAIVK